MNKTFEYFSMGEILRQLLLQLAENSRRVGGMGGLGLPIIQTMIGGEH
jgi:hypothetical protein